MVKKVKKVVKKDNKKKLVKKIVKKSVAKTLRMDPIQRFGSSVPVNKPITARDAIMMRGMLNIGSTGGGNSPLQPLMTKRDTEEKKIELLRAKKDEYEKNISDMKTKESNLRTEVEKKMKEEKEERKKLREKKSGLTQAQIEQKRALRRQDKIEAMEKEKERLENDIKEKATEEQVLNANLELAQTKKDHAVADAEYKRKKNTISSNIIYAQAKQLQAEKDIIAAKLKETEAILGSEEFKKSDAYLQKVIREKTMAEEQLKRVEANIESRRIADALNARNNALRTFYDSDLNSNDLLEIDRQTQLEQENKMVVESEHRELKRKGIEREVKEENLEDLKRQNVRKGIEISQEKVKKEYLEANNSIDSELQKLYGELAKKDITIKRRKEINENIEKLNDRKNENAKLIAAEKAESDPEVVTLKNKNENVITNTGVEIAKNKQLSATAQHQQNLRNEQEKHLQGIGEFQYFQTHGAIENDLRLQGLVEKTETERQRAKQMENYNKQNEVLRELSAQNTLLSQRVTQGMTGDEQYELYRTANDHKINEERERVELIKNIDALIRMNPGLVDVFRSEYSDYANFDSSFVNWDVIDLRKLLELLSKVQARGPPDDLGFIN